MPTGKVTYPESSSDDPANPGFSLVPGYLIYADDKALGRLMIYWPDPGFKINHVVEFDIEELELEYMDKKVGICKKIKVDTAICAVEPTDSAAI